MIDLLGPKIHVGKLRNKPIVLKKGTEITLPTRTIEGSESVIPIVDKQGRLKGMVSIERIFEEWLKMQQCDAILFYAASFFRLIASPARMRPPLSTLAKIPSRGIMQSPVIFLMAQALWHFLPICVTCSTMSLPM